MGQVNATGVMPVIFSSTLMSLPTGLARYAPWLEPVAAALGPTGLLYLPVRSHTLLTASLLSPLLPWTRLTMLDTCFG